MECWCHERHHTSEARRIIYTRAGEFGPEHEGRSVVAVEWLPWTCASGMVACIGVCLCIVGSPIFRRGVVGKSVLQVSKVRVCVAKNFGSIAFGFGLDTRLSRLVAKGLHAIQIPVDARRDGRDFCAQLLLDAE